MNDRTFVSAAHYRIFSGLGLAMICVAQDFQDIIVPNIGLAVLGLWMVFDPRPRVAPLFIVMLSVVQLAGHYQNYQSLRFTPTFVPFEPIGLLLSAGTMLFLGGQYRLLALRWHAAPHDPRFPKPLLHDPDGRPQVVMTRPESSLSPREIVVFLIGSALCVLFGQWAWERLSDDWIVTDFLPPRFLRFAFLIWLMVIGLFVGGGVVGYWRSVHDDPARARLYLQEIAWSEARREYGRIGRWIAWGKRRMSRGRRKSS